MSSAKPCDRRAFLGQCAGLALAPLIAGCASLVARPVTPVNGRFYPACPSQYQPDSQHRWQ